jgi:hypothetical protein
MRARVSSFVLGVACVRFYDFGRNKKEILKIMTNELGNNRTRVIHTLAGGARGHENNCGFSPCLLEVKNYGVGVEKSNIIGSQPSVEEGIAEMLNIHMCLTSRIRE